MPDTVIRVQTLTDEAFKPYGKVIAVPTRLPDTSDEVLQWWGNEAALPADGPVGLGMMKVRRRDFIVPKFERHLKTAELLVPLEGPSFVAVAGSGPDGSGPANPAAFMLDQGQAVVLNAGTWHWLPYPLQAEAAFMVVFRRDTSQDDLEFCDLEQRLGNLYRIVI